MIGRKDRDAKAVSPAAARFDRSASSPPSKARESSASKTTTTTTTTRAKATSLSLNTNSDVSDNTKLFKSMSANMALMMEQISKQMCDFQDQRSNADVECNKRIDKLEKALTAIGAEQTKDHNKKHDLLHAAVTEVGNSHGKVAAKHDKSYGDFFDSLDSIKAKLKLQESHLQSIEDTVQDNNASLKHLKAATDDSSVRIDEIYHHTNYKHLRPMLDDLVSPLQIKLDESKKRLDDITLGMADAKHDSIDAIVRGIDGLLSEQLGDHHAKFTMHVNRTVGDHADAMQGKFESHGKRFDDVLGMLDGMPDHDAICKGVHGLLGEHIGEHGGKVMDAIGKLPLPADEKIMLQAIEDMQESVLTTTLEAIEDLKKSMSEHTGSIDELHGKLAGHKDDLAKLMDGMPDHEQLMSGVHGLLGEHLGDGHGKIMSEINALPLDKSEKVMLQAMENMEESVLTKMLEAIEQLRLDHDPAYIKSMLDDHAKELHGKLDTHADAAQELSKMMDGMPDHETLMKGVHGLLSDHMGDHSGAIMDSVNKLPLPPDEKVLLQAIENMQEACLSTTLEEIEKLKDHLDPSRMHAGVKAMLDEHADQLHGKLDGHSEMHDKLATMLDGMPDHDTLMSGVHGLLGDAMSGHSDTISSAVSGLPLPADEKVMLQAIENMQEAVLTQMLEEIHKVREDLSGHTDALHGKIDDHASKSDDLMKMLDGMPDHDAIVSSVHGLLGDHIGDHSGKVMDSINKLPLPADEKVMLQAMENMEESVMTSILEAIEDLKNTVTGHAHGINELKDKMSGHGDAVDALINGMPDHETLMQGVHGLLGEHLGDGHGKIMSEINSLPLDKSEKVMLQAIENMEESMMTTLLEAIQNIQMNVTVQGTRLVDAKDGSEAPKAARTSSPPAKKTQPAPAKPQPAASSVKPEPRSPSPPPKTNTQSPAQRSLSTPARPASQPAQAGSTKAAPKASLRAGSVPAPEKTPPPKAQGRASSPPPQRSSTPVKLSPPVAPAGDLKKKFDFAAKPREPAAKLPGSDASQEAATKKPEKSAAKLRWIDGRLVPS